MKKFFTEFKKFIKRGNVLDMAVGVIVGSSFTAIVTSLNKDILTPLVAVFGGKDFSNLMVTLGEGEGAPVLTYGNFFTAVINFLNTAFILFCIIRIMTHINKKLVKKEEAAPKPPTTKKCPYCYMEIAIQATRCPHCTSEIELEEEKKEETEGAAEGGEKTEEKA